MSVMEVQAAEGPPAGARRSSGGQRATRRPCCAGLQKLLHVIVHCRGQLQFWYVRHGTLMAFFLSRWSAAGCLPSLWWRGVILS